MKQEQYHKPQKRKRHVSLLVLIALLLAATLFWIMNIENLILGPWSNVLSAMFTAFSVVIALLQLHTQSLPTTSVHTEAPLLEKQDERYHDGIFLGVNKRRGAVIVYASRKLRGKPTCLTPRSQRGNIYICANSNIVERRKEGQKIFSSIFPSVQPGHYIVSIQSQQLVADITVYAGCIAEIDWR